MACRTAVWRECAAAATAADRTLSIYLVSKIRFARMAAGAARRAPGAAATTEPF